MAQTQGARSMSRRPLSRFVPHIAGAVIGVTLVAAVLPLPKLLLWNASASAPIGLYRINPFARPAVGDMVAVAPPPALARFMAERHYLPVGVPLLKHVAAHRSEEHTSELQSLMRISYAVFCLKKKKKNSCTNN